MRHETVRSHHDTMDRLTTEASLTLVYLRLILPSRLCQWSRQALTTSLLSPTANVVLSQTPLNLITYAIFYCSQEVVFGSINVMVLSVCQSIATSEFSECCSDSVPFTQHNPSPTSTFDHRRSPSKV